jgi:Leucine-rich repeat (LRR) protein
MFSVFKHTIDLSDQGLTEIPKLPWFVWKLYLYNNKITKIENLPWFVWELQLSGNKIKKIENLPWFVSILNLGRNYIKHITNMPYYNRCYVCDNKIRKNSESTFISNNRIKSAKKHISNVSHNKIKDYSYVMWFYPVKNKYVSWLHDY